MNEFLRNSKIITLAIAVGLGASACGGKKDSALAKSEPSQTTPVAVETQPVSHAEACAAEIFITTDCEPALDSYTLYLKNDEAVVTEYGRDALVRFKAVGQILRFCNGHTLEMVRNQFGKDQYMLSRQKISYVEDAKACKDEVASPQDFPELEIGAGEALVFWPGGHWTDEFVAEPIS